MKKFLSQLIDRWVILLSAFMLGNIRYFRKSIESPDFEKHIHHVSVEAPVIDGKGVYHVSGETFAGNLETSVVVRLWKGHEYPTIFYQHGNVERIVNLFPYRENVFKRIFYPKTLELPDYNLILIRSFMDGEILEHQQRIQDLNYFMARLAFYAVLEEKIIQSFQVYGKKKKLKMVYILAGNGFGGTVVNLHRAYFNTATAYVPLLAGANPGHIFTESDYRRLAGKRVRQNKRHVENRLNFENDFVRVMSHNVYPMLAYYDRVMMYKQQIRGYETKPVNTIYQGHYETFSDTKAIRNHMLQVIEQVQQSSGFTPGAGYKKKT